MCLKKYAIGAGVVVHRVRLTTFETTKSETVGEMKQLIEADFGLNQERWNLVCNSLPFHSHSRQPTAVIDIADALRQR